MHETKMIKIYFPGWQLWTFSLMVNLLVLASPPSSILAQSDSNSANLVNPQASTEKAIADLEPEILSEINRVRTSPQGYAQWLEQQRQYYDGIWLRLPGEKPIRTNRGKQALEEAIAFLKQQQPLPPLASSEATDAAATSELANFANTNNIQFFSYGKKTAAGIVMDLVVDELFPDRRRRQSLLSPKAEDTGVVCKPDPRYAKVCAIAYSDSPLTREVAEVHPTTPATPATANETVAESPAVKPPAESIVREPQVETTAVTPDETAAKLPAVKPPAEPTVREPKVETTAVTPDETAVKLPGLEPTTEPAGREPKVEPTATDQEPAVAAATPEEKDNTDNENVANLPAPPQPQTPPTNAEVDESQASPETKPKTEEDLEIAQAESEIAQIEQEQEQIVENEQESDQPAEVEVEVEEQKAAAPEESQPVAINTETEDFSEKVEEGKLEQGDLVIADDGSLYDYYPMQGKAGESFTIHLESDEFDAFVALVDSNGKTVGENDDINQEDSNSELKVTLPEDGVYNVIVNTYDEKGTGNYVLKVSR
jgi:Bacterial pre-peptidase C-terminal domain